MAGAKRAQSGRAKRAKPARHWGAQGEWQSHMRSSTETRSGVPRAQGGQFREHIRRCCRYGAGIIVYGTLPIAVNTVPIGAPVRHGAINRAYMCPSCEAGKNCRHAIGRTYIKVPNDYPGTAAVVR